MPNGFAPERHCSILRTSSPHYEGIPYAVQAIHTLPPLHCGYRKLQREVKIFESKGGVCWASAEGEFLMWSLLCDECMISP